MMIEELDDKGISNKRNIRGYEFRSPIGKPKKL